MYYIRSSARPNRAVVQGIPPPKNTPLEALTSPFFLPHRDVGREWDPISARERVAIGDECRKSRTREAAKRQEGYPEGPSPQTPLVL